MMLTHAEFNVGDRVEFTRINLKVNGRFERLATGHRGTVVSITGIHPFITYGVLTDGNDRALDYPSIDIRLLGALDRLAEIA